MLRAGTQGEPDDEEMWWWHARGRPATTITLLMLTAGLLLNVANRAMYCRSGLE